MVGNNMHVDEEEGRIHVGECGEDVMECQEVPGWWRTYSQV